MICLKGVSLTQPAALQSEEGMIFRATVSWALTILFAANLLMAGTPAEAARKLKPGQRVTVVTVSGEEYAGRVGSVLRDQLTLTPDSLRKGGTRVLAIQDISSVKRKGIGVAAKVAIGAIGIAVLAVVLGTRNSNSPGISGIAPSNLAYP